MQDQSLLVILQAVPLTEAEPEVKAARRGSTREAATPATSKRSSQSSEQATPPEGGASDAPTREKGQRSLPRGTTKNIKKETEGKELKGKPHSCFRLRDHVHSWIVGYDSYVYCVRTWC